MRPLRAVAALLGLALVGAAPRAPEPEPIAPDMVAAAQRVRAHVEFLADDLLEGRATGSTGLAIGASYVASQFRALGLEPAGEAGSYFQQVPLRRASLIGSPRITYSADGRTHALVAGRDAMVRPHLLQAIRRVDAPLAFVGYGFSEPSLGIDNYAGQDVRGKIAVMMDGAPAGLSSEVAAHLEERRGEVATEKGAVGFIVLSHARGSADVRTYGAPLVDWIGPAGSKGPNASGPTNGIALSDQWAARLFERAPKPLAALRSEARRGRPIASFALAGRMAIEARSHWENFTSPETIGLLRGSDPALAGEYVVMMGHLDHLGIKHDAKPGEDRIYNGALDNAAGVATLIEAAHEFVASGRRPRRSVLFIANTGEEDNLLGADYFAAHPTIGRGRIVAVVDLDMPLLRYNFTDVVAYGAQQSTVARTVAEAGRTMNVAVAPDPMPEQALFVRSDHYRFALRGIPAILLMTGYANGGEAAWRDFLARTYHQVDDDAKQPIDWRAGARYGRLNYRIARALADADQPPRWYDGDFFGNRFAPGQPRAPRAPPAPRRP